MAILPLLSGAGQEPMSEERIAGFIARWSRSAASERANYQLFLIELCDVLNLPRPNPATGEASQDEYVSPLPPNNSGRPDRGN